MSTETFLSHRVCEDRSEIWAKALTWYSKNQNCLQNVQLLTETMKDLENYSLNELNWIDKLTDTPYAITYNCLRVISIVKQL